MPHILPLQHMQDAYRRNKLNPKIRYADKYERLQYGQIGVVPLITLDHISLLKAATLADVKIFYCLSLEIPEANYLDKDIPKENLPSGPSKLDCLYIYGCHGEGGFYLLDGNLNMTKASINGPSVALHVGWLCQNFGYIRENDMPIRKHAVDTYMCLLSVENPNPKMGTLLPTALTGNVYLPTQDLSQLKKGRLETLNKQHLIKAIEEGKGYRRLFIPMVRTEATENSVDPNCRVILFVVNAVTKTIEYWDACHTSKILLADLELLVKLFHQHLAVPVDYRLNHCQDMPQNTDPAQSGLYVLTTMFYLAHIPAKEDKHMADSLLYKYSKPETWELKQQHISGMRKLLAWELQNCQIHPTLHPDFRRLLIS